MEIFRPSTKIQKGLLCYAIRHVFPTYHSFFKLTFIIVHLSMYLMCTSAMTSLFTSTLITLSQSLFHLRPEYLQNSISPYLLYLNGIPSFSEWTVFHNLVLERFYRWASASSQRHLHAYFPSLLQPPWTLSPHSHQAHGVFSWAVSSACNSFFYLFIC